MASVTTPSRTFRLVAQRVGDDCRPTFRVIAYGAEKGTVARADFATLSALLAVFDLAGVDIRLDLQSEGSILFAGEVELRDVQLKVLGFTAPDRGKATLPRYGSP